MKKLFLIIYVMLVFLSVNLTSFACEPCEKIFDFEETVRNSDLIIVAQKISDGPIGQCGGPEWIETKISSFLKGSNYEKDSIKIAHCYGMCPYGINIDDKKYVIMLRKSDDNDYYKYGPVNYGCASKTFLVEGNNVYFEGKVLSMKEFAAKIENLK